MSSEQASTKTACARARLPPFSPLDSPQWQFHPGRLAQRFQGVGPAVGPDVLAGDCRDFNTKIKGFGFCHVRQVLRLASNHDPLRAKVSITPARTTVIVADLAMQPQGLG